MTNREPGGFVVKAGEIYRCSDPECGCEVTVAKEPRRSEADRLPRCFCGREMQRVGSESGSALSGEMRVT
jgi:hypothetical protein